MKKIINFSVMLVAASILFSSCIGSFQLTSKVKNYNDNIGSKWVNELVFVAFCIVPVYELAALADALNGLNLTGVKFRPINVKPFYSVGKGENMGGVQIYITDYANVRKTGLAAITLRDDDELIEVKKTDNKHIYQYCYIQKVLDTLFLNVDNPESENTHCKKDVMTCIRQLNSLNRDYFIIFAPEKQLVL